MHVVSGPYLFKTFAANIVTGQALNGDEYTWKLADYDRDGRADLIGIKKYATASGFLEVHILSGASNYQSFILHTATPHAQVGSNYSFAVGDYNRDGVPDLWIIKLSATGTHKLEVHILSGASGFQQWLLATGTAEPEIVDSLQYEFGLADWDRDGRLDLFLFKKYSTGTGTLEVHVLSGGATFGSYLLHTGTAQPTGSDHTILVGDWNSDGVPDVWAVKRYNTGMHSTEVHILDGSRTFGQFLLHRERSKKRRQTTTTSLTLFVGSCRALHD